MYHEYKKYSEQVQMLFIAMNGVHGEYLDNGNRCSITYYDNRLSAYFGELKEGGFIIDKRPICEEKDFASWVIRCPLLDLNLRDNEVKRFGEKDIKTLKSLEPALSGSYKSLARLVLAGEEKPSSLDSIGLGQYLAYWATRGAFIGKRNGNKISWGATHPIYKVSVSNIPKAEDRYKGAN